jgi:hypothetical protein
MVLRHAGNSFPRIKVMLAEREGIVMRPEAVSNAYVKAVKRNMPKEVLAAEVGRALLVCDEQVNRYRARLAAPHPVRNAKGDPVLDDEGKQIPDIDVEARLEDGISRIEERRARIAGTYSPTKHSIAVLTAADIAPITDAIRAQLTPEQIAEAERRLAAIDVDAVATLALPNGAAVATGG